MIEYFSKPKYLRTNVRVALNLSNYATKADVKNTTGADTLDFAKKIDLGNLKSDVDKLDIDKLKNVTSSLSNLKNKLDKLDIGKLEITPVDLSKLSDAVKNEVFKKTEYNGLVKKINNINTTDTSNLVKKTDNTTKINEIEKKITDHNHDVYIATQEFNKLTSENFAARLKQANLASKTGISDVTDFVKKRDFDDKLKILNKKVTSNKTRHFNTKLDDLEQKVKIISTKGFDK